MLSGALLNSVGCGDILQNRENQAKQLLSEKYDCEFVVESQTQDSSRDVNCYRVVAYPASDMELHFEAKIQNEGKYFSDEYVSKKVSTELERAIEENLQKSLENVRVICTSTIDYCEFENANVKISEFQKSFPMNKYGVYIAVDITEVQNMRGEKLYQILQSAFEGIEPVRGNLQLWFVLPEDIPVITEYRATMTRIDAGFEEITRGAKLIEMSYKDGRMEMKYEDFQKAYQED